MNNKLTLLETCVAHLNDVVIITEAEPFDGPGPRIVFVNDAFVRSTGYSREEVIGQSPRILQGPNSSRAELDRIRAALESWSSVRVELINYAKDGTEFWCELEIVPVANEVGWYTHWIAVQRDITQRKKMQAEIEASNAQLAGAMESARALTLQAQAANEAKSRFLANMSHEIRTPMNAVLGMLSLLSGSTLDQRQLDYTLKAESAAKSLLRLLNEILDFSKIDAQKMVLDPHPFQLDQLAQELGVVLRAGALEKQIEIRVEQDAHIPSWLVGDAFRLMQVLTNLGSNAVKFTDAGFARVHMQLLESTPDAVLVEFQVQDSGIGISQQDLLHIFNDFAQAETSTTRRFGGTGLGLTICKRLVELMGGSLRVHSDAGKGSTFSFALRFAVATDAQTDEGAAARTVSASGKGTKPLEGMRILVVEDNALNQIVARELLTVRGASVTLAANGQLGVDAVATADPMFDVVLMDVQMPVMDGYSATAMIRKELGLKELPVIGLTANAFPADREACLRAGMNAHLGKPFDVNALVSQLLVCTGRVPGIQRPAVVANAGSTALDSSLVPLQIQVLDLDLALRRMGGMHGVYLTAAAEFRTALQGLRSSLQACVETDDMQGMRVLLHTLKGNSGTVGLVPLSLELGRLDSLASRTDSVPHIWQSAQAVFALAEEADSVLERGMDEVAQQWATLKKAQGAPAPQTFVRRDFEKLLALLEANDLAALEEFAALQGQLAGLPQSLVLPLADAVQGLDFGAGAALCHELLS